MGEYYISYELKIIDTGIGISDEGLSKLFIDFGKLDENASRNKTGTGLGLSICKKIIEQMGGRVSVESKIGSGTTFTLHLNSKCLIKDDDGGNSISAEHDKDFTFMYKSPDNA